jgi:MraZ protein
MLKRLLVGFAQEEALDASGRVLVASSLRQFAKLDKQVWLVGQGSHFELWSDEGWQKQQEAMLALMNTGLPPGFESLAL